MTTATLAPTTRQDWQSVITRHLQPALGDLPLWKLTARHCDQLYTVMASSGSGPSRVRCAHVVLHRAVAQAVRWGWLARNPVSAATRPAVPRTTIAPPAAEDVRAVLAAAQDYDPVLACWLQVAVATGARRGEVCALRWGDLDLEAASVRIERSVSATKSEGVAIRPTKTGRVRLVALTASAVRALRLLRARAEAIAATTGRPVQPDDQLFTSDVTAQRPWRPELVTRRWERLWAELGLPRARIHHLRHFVATQLLTAGSTCGQSPTVSATPGPRRHSTSTGRGFPPATVTRQTTLMRYWATTPAKRPEWSAAILEEPDPRGPRPLHEWRRRVPA
jgi:integrase